MKLTFFTFFLFLLCSSGYAGDVAIEWQHVDGAKKYEIKVLDHERVVSTKQIDASLNSWTVSLPVGTYTYQIRVFDKADRPGPWGTPTPFSVNPNPLQLIFPTDGAKVFFQPKTGTTLKWAPVAEAKGYVLEIKSLKGSPIRRKVSKTEAVITGLPPGSYTWRVVPVMSAQLREDLSSREWRFNVEVVKDTVKFDGIRQRVKLEAPENAPAFKKETPLCLFSTDQTHKGPIACGRVASEGSRQFDLAILTQNELLVANQKVYVSPMDPQSPIPTHFSSGETFTVVLDQEKFNYNVSLGLGAGASYFFPMIEFQRVLIPSIAVGLRGNYARDNSAGPSLLMAGFFLSATKYFDAYSYSGLFSSLGLGVTHFKASVEGVEPETKLCPSAFLSLGWQLRPEGQPFNGTVSVGIQYIKDPELTLIESQLNALLPLISLSIGYAF